MRLLGLLSACLLLVSASAGFASVPPGTSVLGPGSATVGNPEQENPCGWLRLNSDGTYEQAYAWIYAGNIPPYYGAFAEYFTGGSPEVCAVVLDLTTVDSNRPHVCDAYIWEDADGQPGTVLCLTPNVDIGPVSQWPNVSRHVIALQPTCFPSNSWWAGEWGHWNGVAWWWVTADLDGNGHEGRPYTNIAPGVGYPTGWNNVDVVFGEFGHTYAMGIGIQAQNTIPTSVPTPGLTAGSWGKVKSLYH